MYSQAAKIFANELYDNLLNTGALKYEGLVCGQDEEFILWSLIPYIAAVAREN